MTYNSVTTISTCLESLFAQTYQDFSINVFDNASTDSTSGYLSTVAHIAVRFSTHNAGYAAAHNWLIDHTESQYVLTLNPDVSLEKGYLQAMVQAIEADTRLGSCAGCLLRVDLLTESPTIIDSTGLFMRKNRRQGLRNEKKAISERPNVPELIFGPDGAAAFYRRTMLDKIRLDGEIFDTDFYMHKEDVDLSWRAQLYGWSSVYVPDAIARHIRGFRPGERQRVHSNLRFYSVRNRYLLLMKNEQISNLLRDIIPVLFYEAGIVLYLLFFERESLMALVAAFSMRHKMMAKRRLINANRCVTWRDLRQWFI